MNSFRANQRVVVLKNVDGFPLNTPGVVARVRTDGSAFVALDKRSQRRGAHPFPATDHRGTHVMAYAEDCKLPTKTSSDRRRAKRTNDRPEPTLSTFGKDHWSTFAYIETRCVDYGARIERKHLRCDPARHPLLAHEGSFVGGPSPTILKGGILLSDHDDWDCIDDLIREGLLVALGSRAAPAFELTAEGRRVLSQLRAHKMANGSFATFVVVDARGEEAAP